MALGICYCRVLRGGGFFRARYPCTVATCLRGYNHPESKVVPGNVECVEAMWCQ